MHTAPSRSPWHSTPEELESNRDHGDEAPTAEVTPIEEAPSFDTTMHVPIQTSLSVFGVLTHAQRNRLYDLIKSWKANSASVYRDDFNTHNVIFALYKTSEPSINGLLLGGLIEPDGSSHT